MEDKTVVAKNKLVRITARKLRLVADEIRGKDAEVSLDILRFMSKRGSLPVYKVLKSAVANAEHNFSMRLRDLYVKEIRIDEGPTYKRAIAGSKGRGKPILKRTASINIKLGIKK